jgi:chaperonin GroEL
VIRVGGATEAEQAEAEYRYSSALSAVSAAHASGVLPGAGVALVAAANHLTTAGVSLPRRGVTIVSEAIRTPTRILAALAQLDPEEVLRAVSDGSEVLDVTQRRVVGAADAGLVDALSVILSALSNGYGMARDALLTVEWDMPPSGGGGEG